MPDVRLSGTFHGRKAGEIVELTDAQLIEAFARQVVAKVYPAPVASVSRTDARRGLAVKKSAAKTVEKGPAKPQRERPAQPSFGDGTTTE